MHQLVVKVMFYNSSPADKKIKGEVHPKMKISYLVVFGALCRMVKVRGAFDKPFWIYKRLNTCAPPPPPRDVLVVEEEMFLCAGHAKEATTKTSSVSDSTRCSAKGTTEEEYVAHKEDGHVNQEGRLIATHTVHSPHTFENPSRLPS